MTDEKRDSAAGSVAPRSGQEPNDDPSSSFPAEATFRQWMENQAQEIALRHEELSLRRQEIVNTHTYARETLQAQLSDRDRVRTETRVSRRDRMWFGAFTILVVVGFVVYALHLGKDEIAMEVLKAATYLATGGVGGYALRSVMGQKVRADESED